MPVGSRPGVQHNDLRSGAPFVTFKQRGVNRIQFFSGFRVNHEASGIGIFGSRTLLQGSAGIRNNDATGIGDFRSSGIRLPLIFSL